MHRFLVNRWWALTLALFLGLAGVVGLPAAGRADGPLHTGDPNPGTFDPGQGSGDPDVPINTGQSVWKHGATYGRSSTIGVSGRVAGDVPATPISLSYTVRLAMKYFRLYVMRF